MEEALRLLRAQSDVPLIAFVGDISRTWYADIDVMHAVMEILREARMYRPVRSGELGFEYWLRVISSSIGLVDFDAGSTKKEGRYIRDVGMLDGVCMVVAFPAEETTDREGTPLAKKKQPSLETADPAVIEAAQKFGIPILCVYRNGRTEWCG